MYARVARFEGGEGDAIRQNAREIASRGESGPPEGVARVSCCSSIPTTAAA